CDSVAGREQAAAGHQARRLAVDHQLDLEALVADGDGEVAAEVRAALRPHVLGEAGLVGEEPPAVGVADKRSELEGVVPAAAVRVATAVAPILREQGGGDGENQQNE